MMFDGQGRALRLLPWTNERGGPCWLSTTDPDSHLSRMADELEADMIASAECVLEQARELFAETAVGERELRFAGTRLAESLGDTLRIAESRGGRLESGGNVG
ncbi:hypothetical protein [Streptomyces sp. NBC_01089]|uniref:hypothetical protein n=1 Tax=Streptomyces sp. NBC_01089 TaxID=2903747 RepID=UPI003868DACC|nr:hypothetical protein OG510_28300 [Streptomyces sp. NBC_01089]